jgi:hypothetical protein
VPALERKEKRKHKRRDTASEGQRNRLKGSRHENGGSLEEKQKVYKHMQSRGLGVEQLDIMALP